MKATYNNSKEIAELYINSGLKDSVDLKVLVNESCKLYAEKHGMYKAKEIAMKFNNSSIFTVDGLASFLEAIEVESVNFADPFNGEIENQAYIHLK